MRSALDSAGSGPTSFPPHLGKVCVPVQSAAQVCNYIFVHRHMTCIYVYMYIHVCICICMYICIHVHVCVCVGVCVWVGVSVCVCVCVPGRSAEGQAVSVPTYGSSTGVNE
jgi:hypothetical protein